MKLREGPVTFLLIATMLLAPTLLRAQSEYQPEDLFNFTLDELLDVEITTAGKHAEVLREIPASVVLITREEIAALGYRNIQEILENVPGFFTVDNYASNDVSLGVRGFWAPFTRGVVIMVNGVDMKQDKYSHYPLEKVQVPVASIDRIEIIRGPMSVIYGSGASFGAINIITADFNSADETNRHLSVAGGSSRSVQAAVQMERSFDKTAFLSFDAAYDASLGLDTDFGRMSSSPYYQNHSTQGFFENRHGYFHMAARLDDFYADISLIRSEKPWYFVAPNVYAPNEKRSDFATFRLGYNTRLSDKFNLHQKLGYYVTNIQSGVIWPYDPYSGAPITPETHPHMMLSAWSLNSAAVDAELNISHDVSSRTHLLWGLYYKRLIQNVERDELPSLNFSHSFIEQPSDHQLATYAAFLQATVHASKRLHVTAGFRLEKNGAGENIWPFNIGDSTSYSLFRVPLEATPLQFIPRLAVIYHFNDRHSLKLLYGRAVRMPSYVENNDVVLYPAAKPLEPERIQTVEINYLGNLSRRLSVNFSLYHNALDNLIYRREWMRDEVYTATTTNEGTLRSKGVELSLKSRFTDALQVNASLCMQETEDKTAPDRTVSNSPTALGYVSVIGHVRPGLEFGCSGHWVGRRVAQWDVSRLNVDGSFGGRMSLDAPAYWDVAVNMRWSRIPGLKDVYLNGHISNVLNTAIRHPAYTMSQWADKGTLAMGRRVLLTIGKEW